MRLEGDSSEPLFGFTVASGADFDGDGRFDFAIGSCRSLAQGGSQWLVHLVSSATGQQSWTREFAGDTEVGNSSSEQKLSGPLLVSPDVNDDGVPELLVSQRSSCGSDGKSTLTTLSGMDGAILREVETGGRNSQGELDLLDDLDADGVPDLVMGTCSCPETLECLAVVSGRDGSAIRTLENPEHWEGPSRYLGNSLVALDDLNGDGVRDYAAGLVMFYGPSVMPGEVWVLSGKDNSRIATLTTEVVSSWPVGTGERDD